MSDMSMLINGLKVTAEKGATFERRNPLDGSVATRAPAASPADAVMAVEAAAEAFKTWSETGPSLRRALLLKAADALEAKTPAFIEAVSAETGATTGVTPTAAAAANQAGWADCGSTTVGRRRVGRASRAARSTIRADSTSPAATAPSTLASAPSDAAWAAATVAVTVAVAVTA